ncbi:MAG: VCBS repeat-containing protein [Verrucomicrobiales bacterium]|nr:VCBS repeat-containing protein [Verrucomicrobiales bacterium]
MHNTCTPGPPDDPQFLDQWNLLRIGVTNAWAINTGNSDVLLEPTEDSTWWDCDNDGDLDLWFEEYRGYTRLHQNDGDGFFTLATPPSFAQSPGGHGVWADFDNDGYPELFVGGDTETGVRPNALYRGTAGEDFQNVATTTGVALTMATWASAVGDYDNDGWLEISALHGYEGGANAAKTNVLFHKRRDGTFEPDVTPDQLLTVTELVRITPVRPSSSLGGSVTLTSQLSGTWQWYRDAAALDGQTAKTLTLSNSQVQNALYRNLGADSFIRVTNAVTAGFSMSWCGLWADFGNNGTLDLFVVHPFARRNELFSNDGTGRLEPATAGSLPAGAATCYAVWADLDNDGRFDLLTTDSMAATDTPGVLKFHRNLGGWQCRRHNGDSRPGVLGRWLVRHGGEQSVRVCRTSNPSSDSCVAKRESVTGHYASPSRALSSTCNADRSSGQGNPKDLITSRSSMVAIWDLIPQRTFKPAARQSRRTHSVLCNWELTGTTNKSPGCPLSPMTIAGRTFRLLRSENGIGNRMTSPRAKLIEDIVGGVVPRASESVLRLPEPRRASLVLRRYATFDRDQHARFLRQRQWRWQLQHPAS